MSLHATAAIKDFVQTTLGCTCPEEVFDDIEVIQPPYPATEPYTKKLIVGNRLLIYLLQVGDTAALQTGLPHMLNAGKRERDEKGLNRFRAVIVTEADIGALAATLFTQSPHRDDKVHLHIVDPDQVANL